MDKNEMMINSQSRLNQAHPKEPLFVIRACDPNAVGCILYWIQQRMPIGSHREYDDEVRAAMDTARAMMLYHCPHPLDNG